jgi:hypothetical protein
MFVKEVDWMLFAEADDGGAGRFEGEEFEGGEPPRSEDELLLLLLFGC